ncbi:MAG: peptide chain release factor aRF-1 [Candidatus Hadarchaeia archaeon]
MSGDSKNEYQYRKLLDRLGGIKGRGTELISVYIPPDFDLNQVIQQLREEEGTAENIKSKNTRKNVVSALRRIINFLQKYAQTNENSPPGNGMAIFSGNTTGKEGKTDIELFWIEPPEPVQSRIYRCDQDFLLDPLRESIETQEKVGLLTLDAKEATVATLRGKNLNVDRHMTSSVWGKHSKGGQSSQRFERLRDKALHQFLKRVGEAANREFAGDSDIKAILVGGPGPTKNKFLKEEFLKRDVDEKIVSVFDTGYSSEQGIKELVNKADEVLEDLEVSEEKSLVQRFLSGVASGDVPVTYGVPDVRKHLRNGAVETLLVSEKRDYEEAFFECSHCGNEFEEIFEVSSNMDREISQRECPECGRQELSVSGTEDVIQELCDLADQTGAEVVFISTETEEGQQFNNAFKGIGAILRFKIS